jgi:hypothetical protein
LAEDRPSPRKWCKQYHSWWRLPLGKAIAITGIGQEAKDMILRTIGTHVLGLAVVLATMGIYTNAQVSGTVQASSATYVAAEMTKGKLNPAQSKPGDEVALKLKEDVKSNGQVLLKKGTTITGIVRNEKRVEGKDETNGQAQSMMEIEWLAPTAQGKAAQQLSIALQSVTHVSPLFAHAQNDAFADAGGTVAASPARSSSASAAGGLLGGAVGGIGGVGSTLGGATAASNRVNGQVNGQTNAALLSMPTVVAADHQTTSAVTSSLGTSESGRLFKTGSGELITAGGSRQSIELFSHLNNDTVITSQHKNFEISSGAQMQLLVGVDK